MAVFWIEPILAVFFGYILGSIPFGLILTRLSGGGDLRDIGSGNIGATNVLRTGNKAMAVLTLLFDAGKGFAAVLIAEQYMQNLGILAGMGAFLGHLYPIWLKFKGGKGVATLLGMILALNSWMGLTFAAVWIAALLIFRFSSLAGMLATLSLPITAAFLEHYNWVPLLIALGLLLFWKHRENIQRLLSGTEPKVGSS